MLVLSGTVLVCRLQRLCAHTGSIMMWLQHLIEAQSAFSSKTLLARRRKHTQSQRKASFDSPVLLIVAATVVDIAAQNHKVCLSNRLFLDQCCHINRLVYSKKKHHFILIFFQIFSGRHKTFGRIFTHFFVSRQWLPNCFQKWLHMTCVLCLVHTND